MTQEPICKYKHSVNSEFLKFFQAFPHGDLNTLIWMRARCVVCGWESCVRMVKMLDPEISEPRATDLDPTPAEANHAQISPRMS